LGSTVVFVFSEDLIAITGNAAFGWIMAPGIKRPLAPPLQIKLKPEPLPSAKLPDDWSAMISLSEPNRF